MFKETTTIHRAVVIDIYDKEYPRSGRVQVYIPTLHTASLQLLLKNKPEFKFRWPGDGVSDLTRDIIDNLKTFCPWALPVTPIVDAGAGYYDADSGTGTTTEDPCISLNDLPSPASNFTGQAAVLNCMESHGNPQSILSRNGNPFAFDVNAPNYSNLPKGVFTYPRVGSSVLVMFLDGNINYPVYMGNMPDAIQFNQIFSQAGFGGIDGQSTTPN